MTRFELDCQPGEPLRMTFHTDDPEEYARLLAAAAECGFEISSPEKDDPS